MWKIAIVVVSLAGASWAQVTERISVASGGAESNDQSWDSSISADGRFVAFSSDATNLVPGDTNGFRDIFVRDRQSGATELVSVSSTAVQGNQSSYQPSISADGRYVAFASDATNLVSGDTNGSTDIFVRDRLSGTTTLVSVDSGGAEGNGGSYAPSISGDGLTVAFGSDATNLISGGTNSNPHIFCSVWQSNYTEIVSVDSSAAQGNAGSFNASISADGRLVAFESDATNLVPGDTNGARDIFLRQRSSGMTTRMSVDANGSEGNAASRFASISADGLCVVFESNATNLVSFDTNGVWDIFCRTWQNNYTEIVSVDSSATVGNAISDEASISGDGRYVVFASDASNLVPGDTNGFDDVFLRDRSTGTTTRVSLDSAGAQGNGGSFSPRISADARFVSFGSFASSLVPGDTNGVPDIFVRDRDATVFTPFCEPGIDGVMTCPCGNPPTGPGLGCNNFAPAGGTGGARLSGSGLPSIAADTVSLDISNTLKQVHVLFVGTTLTANVRTGAGVRCVNSGANSNAQSFLKRIIKQTPTNGPPSTMSFTGIQAASIAKGAPPLAGQTYYYYAAYRNAAANGQPGCPGLSFGFNATNAGSVTWYP